MPSHTHIDGGELLIRALQAEGVEIIFALPDPAYGPIFRSAEDHGIRIVGGRHESANGHMAEGWFRSTGKVAATIATGGPGYANLIPAIICAYMEGIPMVAIANQRHPRADRAIRRNRFQWTPQIDILRPTTKFCAIIPSARHIPEYLREAFRAALSGRKGPVFLEIDVAALRDEVDESTVPIVPPSRYRFSPGTPDQEQINAAADQLAQAQRLLFVAGSGVSHSGAWDELRALAEYSGAAVMMTGAARGVIPETHPQWYPYFVSSEGTELTHTADVVFAVGTQIGELLGYGRQPIWGPPAEQKWIHLEADPQHIGVNREVDVALIGDLTLGLTALLEGLQARGPARKMGQEAKSCIANIREFMQGLEGLAEMEADPIHPARLASTVASFFAPHTPIVAFDGGNTALWAHMYHRFTTPRSLLWTGHFGHLGTGIPYALGAKLANPDRMVYVLTGDGAFGFNMAELETAARERANIIVIVANDSRWGMEQLGQLNELGRTIGVQMSPVRYDDVARGLGCHAEYVDRLDDLEPALERSLSAHKPSLVQVIVDSDLNINPPLLTDFYQMYDAVND